MYFPVTQSTGCNEFIALTPTREKFPYPISLHQLTPDVARFALRNRHQRQIACLSQSLFFAAPTHYSRWPEYSFLSKNTTCTWIPHNICFMLCERCLVFVCSEYHFYFEGDFLLWRSTGCRNTEVCDDILVQHDISMFCNEMLVLFWIGRTRNSCAVKV